MPPALEFLCPQGLLQETIHHPMENLSPQLQVPAHPLCFFNCLIFFNSMMPCHLPYYTLIIIVANLGGYQRVRRSPRSLTGDTQPTRLLVQCRDLRVQCCFGSCSAGDTWVIPGVLEPSELHPASHQSCTQLCSGDNVVSGI